METITVNKLDEVLTKHQGWLENEVGGKRADLSDIDLSGLDMSGADLRNSDLSYANLSCANLSGAVLSYTNLSGANLSYANLSGAVLRDANLSCANLSCANLSGADLIGADMRDANLSGANLILVGQDMRGFLFWSSPNEEGVVVLRAGCRHFVGISAARAHWMARHNENPILKEDCLSLVDRCERMAKAHSWKLNPQEVICSQ